MPSVCCSSRISPRISTRSLRVEVRERLVEQQHLGLDHQGAGDGDALQLAAGELVRPALAVAFELDEAQGAQRRARRSRSRATLRALRP